MEITEVRVFPVNEDKLKAYATITFDHCFVVRDLKVIQGNNGLFVAMPSKKRKDGTFKDTAHPLNTETRELIESKVLAEYRNELERTGAPPPEVGDRLLSKEEEPDGPAEEGEGSDSGEDA
jgi:stage V sporulation protein G